ncbi:MAG: hypothetical protein ABIW46_08165 [Acidimicrobiales bacterium]
MAFLRTAVGVAVAVAVSALSGCSGEADGPAATPPTQVVGLEASVPATPAGFVPRDAEARDFDLQQYTASLSISPDADRTVMEAGGFRRGLVRAWSKAEGGTAVTVYVFEMGDAAGAAALQEHFVVDGQKLLQANEFAVPGVDGAQGASYDRGTPAAPTRVHAVYLTSGPRFFNILASHLDTSAGPEVALDFARLVAAR